MDNSSGNDSPDDLPSLLKETRKECRRSEETRRCSAIRKSIPRRDFHLQNVDVSQIILVIITSWDAPLFFNLAIRDLSFFLFFLKNCYLFVRVQHLRVAQRVTTLCTVPSVKRMTRTSKLQESLFDSWSDALPGYFYLISKQLPFFVACATNAVGNQRQQFVTFYEISTSTIVEFISSPRREERTRTLTILSRFFLYFFYSYPLGRGGRLVFL